MQSTSLVLSKGLQRHWRENQKWGLIENRSPGELDVLKEGLKMAYVTPEVQPTSLRG